MFDEWFARQYRYEPPPEFLLASLYTSIVRHLSGLKLYALTQIPLRKTVSVHLAVPQWRGFRRVFTFISPLGLQARRLAHNLNSLVRVTRRDDRFHLCQSPYRVQNSGQQKVWPPHWSLIKNAPSNVISFKTLIPPNGWGPQVIPEQSPSTYLQSFYH